MTPATITEVYLGFSQSLRQSSGIVPRLDWSLPSESFPILSFIYYSTIRRCILKIVIKQLRKKRQPGWSDSGTAVALYVNSSFKWSTRQSRILLCDGVTSPEGTLFPTTDLHVRRDLSAMSSFDLFTGFPSIGWCHICPTVNEHFYPYLAKSECALRSPLNVHLTLV